MNQFIGRQGVLAHQSSPCCQRDAGGGARRHSTAHQSATDCLRPLRNTQPIKRQPTASAHSSRAPGALALYASMYLAHAPGGLPEVPGAMVASAHAIVKVGDHLHALDCGARRAPSLVSAGLSEDGLLVAGLAGGAAQVLLAPSQSVLDGDRFVAAAAQLPAGQLAATLQNCLLECTNTRVARPLEQAASGLSGNKVNYGVAGLVQQVAACGSRLQLFPAVDGLPTLQQLLHATVLPPSATSKLMSAPVVQLFAAHSTGAPGAGRRSVSEHFDVGAAPSLYDRMPGHVRSAARAGSTFLTLASGMPLWQRFQLEPPQQPQQQQQQPPAVPSDPGPSAAGGTNTAAAAATAATAGAPAATKQQRQKRKQPAAASGDASKQPLPQQQPLTVSAQPGASGSGSGLNSSRPAAPASHCTLRQSACGCCSADLGAVWCSHRCDAMSALLSDPALHVLDVDALASLLAPLSTRQLAQLLLMVSFACGTLPDVILSLQLPAERQAGLFLPCLGPLPLFVPCTSDLRMWNYSASDAVAYSIHGPTVDPYLHSSREYATSAANPEAPPHLATRLSVISGAKGSVLQAVCRRVQALGPQHVWHLKGMGIDVLDGLPETVCAPNATGVWPAEVRSSASLAFEDALGLVQALGMLGGAYTPVALQLLKDLTVTVAHPHYCSAAFQPLTRPSFTQRLKQLWLQLTTPEERFTLFFEGGMPLLPRIWSEVVREVAWQVAGQFPVLWSVYRHLAAAMGSSTRGAAMALMTRNPLLPRSMVAAGASAFTDLLLFERSMRRNYVQFAEGLCSFLRQQRSQLQRAREGSLMQLAARSVVKQLLAVDKPLAESHAGFQDLILDLQGAVLAEGAQLLLDLASTDLPGAAAAPGGSPALDMFLPADLRNAGRVLKDHTQGVLTTGIAHNAEGLQRNALPPHLPPALSSVPFSWVTLDLRRMLTMAQQQHLAACWACAYLQLVPRYSPAGIISLWSWMRQAGMLGVLVGSAVSAAVRRDWHSAAMLADAAVKYLGKAASLDPAGSQQEQMQLGALRPMLRSLALAAAGQLRHCLALHAGGALLTYSGTLRSCCILLRCTLTLTSEVLEPLLLKPPSAAAAAAAEQAAELLQHQQQHMAEALALGAGIALPQEGQILLQLHLAQLQQGMAQLQHNLGAVAQQQQQDWVALGAVGAAGAAAAGAGAGAMGAGAGAGAGVAGGIEVPPLHGPSPASVAAAAAAGVQMEQGLEAGVAEALARDASMLLQVCQVVLELMTATLEAPPLLPLHIGSPQAAVVAGSAARRQQQDTALWRAAEMYCEQDQYAYHDMGRDESQPRTFCLNHICLWLVHQLPVALLPLQPPYRATAQGAAASGSQAAPSTSAAAATAAAAAASAVQQQQHQQQQQQQGASGATTGAVGRVTRGKQRQTEAAAAAAAAAAASAQRRQRFAALMERQLVALLPAADKLAGRMLGSFDDGSSGRRSSTYMANRMRYGGPLSLLCSLLRLTATSGPAGARQLALMPSAWDLLGSYMADVNVASPDRPEGTTMFRVYTLVPTTLLCMLQAVSCTTDTAASSAPEAAAAEAACGSQPCTAAQEQQEQQEEQQQAPPAKRSRRSSRSSSGGQGQPTAPPSRPNSRSAGASTAAAGDDGDGATAGAQQPTAPPPQAAVACSRLCVGGRAVDARSVLLAIQRVLMWLSAGAQEHWRGSAYSNCRPRNPPAQQVPGQQAPPAQQAAVQGQVAAQPQPQQQPQQQAGAGGQHVGLMGGPPGVDPAQRAQQARPRQAFLPRQGIPSVLAAFSSHWPVAAIEVLSWWLQRRQLLQHMADASSGSGGSSSNGGSGGSSSDGAAGGGGAAAAQPAYRSASAVGTDDRHYHPDSREDTFTTLEGTVRLQDGPGGGSGGSSAQQGPKLRVLAGTLLSLLCMECAPELHSSAYATLQGLARQPGAAADLADTPAFWMLQRLLIREGMPPALKQQGQEVVAAVEGALLQESGDWAAVLKSQRAAAVDAEAATADRRAAGAAAGIPLDGAGNPLLAMPPPWFDPAEAMPFLVAGWDDMPVVGDGMDDDDDLDEEEEEDEEFEDEFEEEWDHDVDHEWIF